MADGDNDPTEAILAALLAEDDGQAAKEHLAAGFPIYYREHDTPADVVIKEDPDGRRELMKFDEQGEKIVSPWLGARF